MFDTFWICFGRTKLILGASGAKYCEELDSDVQKYPAPPKLSKNVDQIDFRVRNQSQKTNRMLENEMMEIVFHTLC